LPSAVRSASVCGIAKLADGTAFACWISAASGADEDGCLRQIVLIAWPGLDLRDVDLDRGEREHVRRRVHLVDERIDERRAPTPAAVTAAMLMKVAAADAVPVCAWASPRGVPS
jgi:hypothetical protein